MKPGNKSTGKFMRKIPGPNRNKMVILYRPTKWISLCTQELYTLDAYIIQLQRLTEKMGEL